MGWYFKYIRHWKSYISKVKKYFSPWLAILASLIFIILIISNIWIIASVVGLILSITTLFFNPKFFLILIPLLIVFGVIFYFLYTLDNEEMQIKGEFTVKQTYKNGFVIEVNNKFIYINSKHRINVNSVVQVNGIAKKPINTTGFDFVSYLKSKKIFYTINNPKELLLISNGKHFLDPFENYLKNNTTQVYQDYIFYFLLGKSINPKTELFNLISRLNIIHLFVISGFHIGLFYKLLKIIFKKIDKKYFISFYVFVILVFIYLIVINFRLATLRAYVFFILVFLNSHFLKKYFSNIEILALTAIFFIFLNFYVIFDHSFIYSFTILLFIFQVQKLKFKNKKTKNTAISITAYGIASLINIFFSKSINLWGFVNNIIFTPLILVSIIFSFSLFWLKDLANWYFYAFNYLLLVFDSFSVMLTLSFLSKELITMSLMIIFITLSLKQNKNNFKKSQIALLKNSK